MLDTLLRHPYQRPSGELWRSWSAPLLVALLGFGCAATIQEAVFGSDEIVETSREDKPAWMGSPRCPAERVCSHGPRARASAIEHGRTDVFNDAVEDVALPLETMAEARFTSTSAEDRPLKMFNSLNDYKNNNYIVAIDSKAAAWDAKVEDDFWRRIRGLGENRRDRDYFDYDVLVSVDVAAWCKSIRESFGRERSAARATIHAALVEEMDGSAKELEEEQ